MSLARFQRPLSESGFVTSRNPNTRKGLWWLYLLVFWKKNWASKIDNDSNAIHILRDPESPFQTMLDVRFSRSAGKEITPLFGQSFDYNERTFFKITIRLSFVPGLQNLQNWKHFLIKWEDLCILTISLSNSLNNFCHQYSGMLLSDVLWSLRFQPIRRWLCFFPSLSF